MKSGLCIAAGLAILLLTVCTTPPMAQPQAIPTGWWKGNLHTHSLWSDGDDYPEMIAEWFKKQGYHFLALSDHNVMLEGEKWIDAAKSKGGMAALETYRKRFGAEGILARMDGDALKVRLKTLAEFRPLVEEPGRFLMIPSEEITDKFEKLPVHLNATNLRELIKPQGGKSVREVMQNNVDAVLEQRKRTGQPMFVHLNHPNFGWAVTAEDIAEVTGERFFEVYNGHPSVNVYGDAIHASSERMWDIVLTRRVAEMGLPPIFGVAVDDSHNYHKFGLKLSNAGRGWVVVRAPKLSTEAIVAAMEAGDFYASTGARLRDVKRDGNKIVVEIDEEPGVTYVTQFIGTRKGYDPKSTPLLDKDGKPVTRRYSADIGKLLAEVKGPLASYTFSGDEFYVRAKVVSTKVQPNPYATGDFETAWTQPFVR